MGVDGRAGRAGAAIDTGNGVGSRTGNRMGAAGVGGVECGIACAAEAAAANKAGGNVIVLVGIAGGVTGAAGFVGGGSPGLGVCATGGWVVVAVPEPRTRLLTTVSNSYA